MLQVHSLEQEVDQIRRSAAAGKLAPLPGESAGGSASQLGTVSKGVGASMAQMVTAAGQGDDRYTGRAARATADQLALFVKAVRGVAATIGDEEGGQQVKIFFFFFLVGLYLTPLLHNAISIDW
jgi:talin